MLRFIGAALALAVLATPATAGLLDDPGAFFRSAGHAAVHQVRRLHHRAIAAATTAGANTKGLAPQLIAVIGDLRAEHGTGAVRLVAGKSHRMIAGTHRLSCHAAGEAFDAYLSAAALADVRADRRLGVITYSGQMHHAHVSSCAREAGYRGHQVVDRRGVPASRVSRHSPTPGPRRVETF